METSEQNEIIRIFTFEEMKKYDGDSLWRISDSKRMFDIYNEVYDIYIIKSSKTKDSNFSICCLLICKSNDTVSRLVGRDNVEHYTTDKDWYELLRSILDDKEFERFIISEILHYLLDIGWTELIDSRWKDDVMLDIKGKFPNVSDDIINKILKTILI